MLQIGGYYGVVKTHKLRSAFPPPPFFGLPCPPPSRCQANCPAGCLRFSHIFDTTLLLFFTFAPFGLTAAQALARRHVQLMQASYSLPLFYSGGTLHVLGYWAIANNCLDSI